MYPLPKEIEEAFDSAAVLAVEVDTKNIDKQKMQQLVFAKGLYQGDDLLWNHVGAETKKRVEQFCQTYGIPAERIAKLKPWMIVITAVLMQGMRSGIDPGLGIDKHFLDAADQSKDKKRIVEIESAEWQINLLSGLGENWQEDLLAEALTQKATAGETVKRLKDLWLSGDSEKLGGLMSDGFFGDAQTRKVLVQDRNPHMADIAEQFLNQGEAAFVVVGAAHLVGEEGVVRILEKRGYKLEQLAINR